MHDVVDFSHLVSDSVKKLTAELEMGVDGRGRTRVYDFLERSVIYLEELLSTLYERSIRISIKLAIDDCTFKTYVRGKNNISSRGGQLKCKKKNQKRLKVSKNYAYKALVNKGLAFFAEGDLLHLHNIVGDGDKFYCEEEEFERLFLSTFIMTVRIPRFEEDPEKHAVIGLICIDSEHSLVEWSEKDFTSKVCYHIVADFADSIALLLKKLGG